MAGYINAHTYNDRGDTFLYRLGFQQHPATFLPIKIKVVGPL